MIRTEELKGDWVQELLEHEFEHDKGYGPVIPTDYFLSFLRMLNGINCWLKTGLEEHQETWNGNRSFQSSTVLITISAVGTEFISVERIGVRPCAQGRGLYRLLLWALAGAALKHRFERLSVSTPNERNIGILTSLGFSLDSNSQMTMSAGIMAGKSKEDWGLPRGVPTAEELNDPDFVHRRRAYAARREPPMLLVEPLKRRVELLVDKYTRSKSQQDDVKAQLNSIIKQADGSLKFKIPRDFHKQDSVFLLEVQRNFDERRKTAMPRDMELILERLYHSIERLYVCMENREVVDLLTRHQDGCPRYVMKRGQGQASEELWGYLGSYEDQYFQYRDLLE